MNRSNVLIGTVPMILGDNVSLVGGWERSGIKIYNRENGNGFKAVLYQRKLEGGNYEYAYATAGTEPTDVDDWGENIGQLFGSVFQYKVSTNRARLLSYFLRNSELTFVGHSLGGGLATANALKTGNREAITFNPAALTDETMNNLGISPKSNSAKITNYVVKGEIVDYMQSKVGLHPIGLVVKLNASYIPSSDAISSSINLLIRIYNHLMDTIISKLDEK